ncbi:MAG: tRNA uridine-5-carboxymethylaminomethyl(34) synthesis GTPase MnmE [Bacteroidetes bacterium]|nr:tRNA uridine-5-carboxymethylaminomethyl(34) synthesis GTPase MnmE [Bacteroidota bacterium]
MHDPDSVIVAPATPPGVSGIAIIRLSGKEVFEVVTKCFRGSDLSKATTHTIHFGSIVDGETVIDEVLVSVFREPHSFTKENSIEISCHGSPVVVQRIIGTLLQHGASLAEPGEFTRRAFLNGRFDLAQAEAVADLIHAETDNARQAAINQMRGGFSAEIRKLREELIHFASLIELELDFGEEDVEFARRDELKALIVKIKTLISKLMESFRDGNVIKNGVATVIAGKPNSGKSTLLNALLKEEKAIVSEIPGTTRDVIEDEIVLNGVRFRFIDTAGLRDTQDVVEAIGVGRTREQLKKASLVLHLVDLAQSTVDGLQREATEFQASGVPVIHVANKMDLADASLVRAAEAKGFIPISAAKQTHLKELEAEIVKRFHIEKVKQGDVVVTNSRHYEALRLTSEALERALNGLDSKVTGDFIAMDVRQALHYLGEITGEITTDDLLGNIFSKFCIGK